MTVLQHARIVFVAVSAAMLPLGSDANQSGPAADIASLAQHRASVARVEVFALSANISTAIAVTPAALESFNGVRKRTLVKRADIDALLDALVRSHATPGKDLFDARYGLAFENRRGVRVLTVYTNAFASSGAVDSRPAYFDKPTVLSTALERAAR